MSANYQFFSRVLSLVTMIIIPFSAIADSVPPEKKDVLPSQLDRCKCSEPQGVGETSKFMMYNCQCGSAQCVVLTPISNTRAIDPVPAISCIK